MGMRGRGCTGFRRWRVCLVPGRVQASIPAPAQPVDRKTAADGDEQQYQAAANHTIGKFRVSVTTDPNPKLASPLTPAQLAILDTPDAQRTADQKAKLRQMYLAQDQEYQRLQAEAAKVPPADARVLGAQDLVWALINTPAFLFNR